MRGSLQEKYPEIAKEFHPVLNGKLTPGKVHYKSSKQLYWLCPKCKERWRATIHQRVNNIKPCPTCKEKEKVYKLIGVKNKPLFKEWKKMVELRRQIVLHLEIFIQKGYGWKKNGITARKKLKKLLEMNKEFRKKIVEEREGKKEPSYEVDIVKRPKNK